MLSGVAAHRYLSQHCLKKLNEENELEHNHQMFNRVGSVGLFPTLSSHTTVRAFLAYGGLLE